MIYEKLILELEEKIAKLKEKRRTFISFGGVSVANITQIGGQIKALNNLKASYIHRLNKELKNDKSNKTNCRCEAVAIRANGNWCDN